MQVAYGLAIDGGERTHDDLGAIGEADRLVAGRGRGRLLPEPHEGCGPGRLGECEGQPCPAHANRGVVCDRDDEQRGVGQVAVGDVSVGPAGVVSA